MNDKIIPDSLENIQKIINSEKELIENYIIGKGSMKYKLKQKRLKQIYLLQTALDTKEPNFLQLLMKGFETGLFTEKDMSTMSYLRKIMEFKDNLEKY